MPAPPSAAKQPKSGGPGPLEAALAHRGLLLILLAGVAVRMWNIGWGLPHLYEEAIPLRFGMKLWPSLPPSIDDHFFVYPAFGYYLHLFVQLLHFCFGFISGAYENLAGFISAFDTHYSAYVIVSRTLTILVDLAIALLCYRLLDRHYHRRAALIAAAMIAFNALHIRQSHLINVDTLLAFFSVALVVVLFDVLKGGGTRSSVLSGALVGLAAASKYNGALMALAVITAHFLAPEGVRMTLRPAGLTRLAGAGAAAIIVFLACNPLILTHAGEFIRKFSSTETHMEAGHLGLDPGSSTAGYYFLHSLPNNLGLPIALVVLATIIGFLRRDHTNSGERKKTILLLIVPAIDLASLSMWEMRADRYILPVVPFLLMIAAVGTDLAFSTLLPSLLRGRASRIATGSGTTAAPTPGGPWMMALAVALLLIPPLRDISTYQRTAGLKDTRTAALEWIAENIPTGSAIAAGPFGIDLPPRSYINLPIQFSAVNSERMTPFYNPEWYRDVALVAVSDFDLGRYQLEPGRFHTILAYFDTLESGWTLVRAFEPGDSLSGPSIRLYRYPGATPDVPFSTEVIAELLESRLETDRKVAFLGKLGLILAAQGKVERSGQLFTHLLALDPGNETARKSLRDIERYRAAGAPGTTAGQSAGSGRAVALARQGDRLLERGNAEAAEKAYVAALKIDSTVTDAYIGLTMVYALREDREAVILTLRKLLSILPPGSDEHSRVLAQLKSIEERPR